MPWGKILQQWSIDLRQRRHNRRFRRRALTYLEQRLGPALGLRQWSLLSDHYRRKLFIVEGEQGRAFCKFYWGKAARLIPRYLALDPLLRQHGALTPKILFIDEGDRDSRHHGMGCLVLEWIDQETHEDRCGENARAAIENLTRLHEIRAEEVDGRMWRSAGGVLPDPAGPQWGTETARELLEMLGRDYFPIAPAEAEKVMTWLRRGVERLSPPPPECLLHLDYSPSNLRTDKQGRLYTLDFDEARFGWFGYNLALALLHHGHGFDSESLDTIDIDQLGLDERCRPLGEAYFAKRGDAGREQWTTARPWTMAWAYLWVIANRAKRSSNAFRYRWKERVRYLKTAQLRWRRLARAAETV